MWDEADKFVDDFNKLLSDCSNLWSNIYHDAKESALSSLKLDIPHHHFVSLIYGDAVGWALGKNLTLIRKEDYDYGHSGDKKFVVRCQLPDRLVMLIEFPHEDKSTGFQLAASIRDAHMMLREKYRQSDQAKSLAEAMHRLEVQRDSILRSLKQLATVLKTS